MLADAKPIDLKIVCSVLKSDDAMLALVPGEAGGVGLSLLGLMPSFT